MKSTLLACGVLLAVSQASPAAEPKSTPWQGKPAPVPGKIEAEHYDEGAADVAYHDVESKNLGEPYRKDTQVDIEKRNDASNGYGVGWTRKGEWINYTVNVADAGRYDVVMPVASNKDGGVFHFEVDGQDLSGPIKVPDTGGWDKLRKIRHGGLKLREGVQTIRVVMDSPGPSGSIGDIDCFIFSPASKSKAD